MKDFKIGDSIEVKTSKSIREELKRKRRNAIIIVVIISLLIGLITYLVSNSIIGDKKDNNYQEEIPITDENVQILYSYVTYGTRGVRNTKFATNTVVNISSFTNEEKFYYALQLADPNDFSFTGELNDNKKKIYIISNKTIQKYMQLFFGPQITYSNNIELTYPFSFRINQMNVGTMKYNSDREGFDTTFDSLEDNLKNEIEEVYGDLVSAKIDANGKMILEEKVIYTNIVKNSDNTNNIEIYKDYNKEILLETINNITKEEIEDLTISLSKYTNTSIIEYTFALNGTTYYFESSSIKL